MQAKTFYAPQKLWLDFQKLCKRLGKSMNSRITYLVTQDAANGETVWSLYKGVDPSLRKQFERLCEISSKDPIQRVEELIRQECHHMIESEIQ